jgi:hypothetical protein
VNKSAQHLVRSILAIGVVLLGMAAIGYCSKAQAQHVLGAHMATAHFGADLKAETPGLYARHSNGATAGFYRNSYGQWSTYAAWSWQTPGKTLALTVGAVTGYPAARVMPLVVPSARVPLWQGAALRLAYIPKPLRHGTAAGLHLAIEHELEF